MTPPGLLGEIATKLVGVRETGSGARGRRGDQVSEIRERGRSDSPTG